MIQDGLNATPFALREARASAPAEDASIIS